MTWRLTWHYADGTTRPYIPGQDGPHLTLPDRPRPGFGLPGDSAAANDDTVSLRWRGYPLAGYLEISWEGPIPEEAPGEMIPAAESVAELAVIGRQRALPKHWARRPDGTQIVTTTDGRLIESRDGLTWGEGIRYQVPDVGFIDTVHVCAVCGSRREEPGAPLAAGEMLEVDSAGKRIFHTVCEACQAAGRKAAEPRPPLTWRRLVAMVEAKLAEAGVEDAPIEYADFRGFSPGGVDVYLDAEGLTISG